MVPEPNRRKESSKVKPVLLALAAALLAAAPAAAQIVRPVPTFSRGAFNLAEAYPCAIGTYDTVPAISGPKVFGGRPDCPTPAPPPGAAPGVLALQRKGNILDVNCFAVVPLDEVGPCVVQSYRLTKSVPGSAKCPDVYGFPGGSRFFQFGSGVRTWWSLNFTQPGTQFVLEVVSACRTPSTIGIGNLSLHKDVWTWRVVASAETMAQLIELMHGGAVSTLEVPCIIGEDMYDALKQARERLAAALRGGNPLEFSNAVFDFEALIISNCLFFEVLDPRVLFRGQDQLGMPSIQPPGNLAPTVRLGVGITAVAGIIDTTEHPCCCKLLVDLEAIFRAGPTAVTLPQPAPDNEDL
jgi:hypothetical protein